MLGAGLTAPRTSSQNAQSNNQEISNLCQQISRCLGIEIEPRPVTWTLGKGGNSIDSGIQNSVQHLFFQARTQLDQAIEALLAKPDTTAIQFHEILKALSDSVRRTPVKRPASDPAPEMLNYNNDQTQISRYQWKQEQESSLSSTTTCPETSTAATSFEQDVKAEPARKRGLEQDVQAGDTKRVKSFDGSQSSNIGSNDASTPSRAPVISHHLSNLSQNGFGKLPELDYDQRDWAVSWELARLIAAYGPNHDIISQVCSIKDLHSAIALLAKRETQINFIQSKHEVFHPPDDGQLRATISAEIHFSQKHIGPLFQIVLDPIRFDRTCRAQRKYGWDRILYVKVPLSPLPSFVERDPSIFKASFVDWLMKPHKLLGRTWRAFHIEEYKKKQSTRRKQADDFRYKRVTFFATDGVGLYPHDFEEFVNWLVPLRHNNNQPYCKAAARIDLSLSKTDPSLIFSQDQIQVIDDLYPTTAEDEMPFQDPGLRFKNQPRREYDKCEAMTDGCGIVSVGAALEICKHLRLNTRPAAFQARCFGAKGMWIISNSYDTTSEYDKKIWIQIRRSQLKVRHGQDSEVDYVYQQDLSLRSFDVNQYSQAAKPSELHRDFLQVLVDRGVSPGTIKSFLDSSVEDETETMLKATEDPEEYVLFLQRGNFLDEIYSRDEFSGLPISIGQKLLYFASEGGFMPVSSGYFAQLYTRYCCSSMIEDLQRMRIKCAKSTFLFGVPDPTGKLSPGHVHVSFSRAFSQGDQHPTISTLAGHNVIIARDPTLRGSDIQKYKAVFLPEVAHLQDVLVFPSIGNMPSAARHQGGDYDGDRFWICWDDTLVCDFQNAPVLLSKSAEELGIEKDTLQLGQLVSKAEWGSRQHSDEFLRKAFEFRLQRNLLGPVTNLFYHVAYHDLDLYSPRATMLADLHDHIIDSLKNGYIFDDKEFDRFTKHNDMPRSYAEHHYQKSMTGLENVLKPSADFASSELADRLQRFCECEMRKNNEAQHILDVVYFSVKLPCILRTIRRLTECLHDIEVLDKELLGPLNAFRDYMEPKTTNSVISSIETSVKDVSNLWSDGYLKKQRGDIKLALQQYNALAPPKGLHWMEHELGKIECTPWKRLCASVFYNYFYNTRTDRKQARLFGIAGSALCHIKKGEPKGRRAIEIMGRLRKYRRKPCNFNVSGMVESAEESVLKLNGAGNESETEGANELDDSLLDTDILDEIVV